MAEKIKENWLKCPGAVKERLPKKIQQAVQYALDECFLEIVGEPAAQRDKFVYKEIKKRICQAMQEWVKEAMDEAINDVLETEK